MNVTCVGANSGCLDIVNSKCAFYEGENLLYIGINTNDNLQNCLEKINTAFESSGIGGISSLVGDVLASGIGQVTATLATTGVTPGVYGTASSYPVITVDAKGRITAAYNQAVSVGSSSLAFIGDVTGSGTTGTNTTLTLATVNPTTGTFGTDHSIPIITVDGKGRITNISAVDMMIPPTTINLIGDVTGSGDTGTNTNVTLKTVNSNIGTFGSATLIPSFTVNAKGLITAVTTNAISIPSGGLTFVGDVTGIGTTGTNTTLTLATVNANNYGINTFLKFAVNAKGLVTSAAAVASTDITTALGYTPVTNARTITINGVSQDLSADRTWNIVAGVSSFNTRTGAITLTSADVTNALGFTPADDTSVVKLAGIQTITGSKTFSSLTADSGISLKEGVVPSGVGYTGLAGDPDGLLITKRVGSTAYTNLLYFTSATSNTYTFPNASGTIALTSNLSSYVPTTRTLTINGVAYDLSADRSWTIAGGGGIATVSGTAPISASTVSGAVTISISKANATTDGYVSAADWNTFNDKQAALGFTPENSANKSSSTTLDGASASNTKYPTQLAVKTYVDNATSGGLIIQGDWNASTNNPDISTTTNTGWAWRVSVAGTTSLGGINVWNVNDIAVKTATGWIKIDNSSSVTSVFGRTGAVVAVSGDYDTDKVTEGTNLYFTTARARGSVSADTGISYDSATGKISSTITQYTDALARAAIALTTTGSSGASTYNNTTGALNIPNYTLAGLGGQPLDADLTAIAALSGTSGLLRKTAADTWTLDTNTYATTTALGNYLPLAGGTLTGALTVDIAGNTPAIFKGAEPYIEVTAKGASNTAGIKLFPSSGYDAYIGNYTPNKTTAPASTSKLYFVAGNTTAALLETLITGTSSSAYFAVPKYRFNTAAWGNATFTVDGYPEIIDKASEGLSMKSNGFSWYAVDTTTRYMRLDTSGNLTANAFFESSDIRFKNVLETNPEIDLSSLDVIKFTRKGNEKIRYGYSAQQVRSLLPDVVDGDDMLTVNYSDVHTLKIAKLEKRVAELEALLAK